jgi:hypothetical protein
MMESFVGRSREEGQACDDNVMLLTPMSQPVGEGPTFPPNARPSILSKNILNYILYKLLARKS